MIFECWQNEIQTPTNLQGQCSLGCWKDGKTRAIAGGKRLDSGEPIGDCYNFAKKKGYLVFAVQNGKECFTAEDAHETFTKYGKSTNCNNGQGGSWALNVYLVSNPECKIFKSLFFNKL